MFYLKRFLISGIRAAILALLMLALFSCGKQENRVSKTGAGSGIHKTFERGPVTVTIGTDKKEITIADRLNFTISVVADEDYEIKLPGLGEKLEQFGVVDYHTSQPELIGKNRKKISRSYVLEPFLSGDYTIPAMKVRFWKKGKEKEDQHEIETEKIVIKVKSLLPEKMQKMKLHDIKPPVQLPSSYSSWIWPASIAGTATLIGLAVFLIIHKRRRAGIVDAIIARPAHEIAFEGLEKLMAEKLIEKGEIKRFYERISDILRRYIEDRFGINAPEQTTEEFLAGLKAREDFPANHKLLLKKFLTHCDLVKFAEHRPQNEDIKQTFESCKEFISGTKEDGNSFPLLSDHT